MPNKIDKRHENYQMAEPKKKGRERKNTRNDKNKPNQTVLQIPLQILIESDWKKEDATATCVRYRPLHRILSICFLLLLLVSFKAIEWMSKWFISEFRKVWKEWHPHRDRETEEQNKKSWQTQSDKKKVFFQRRNKEKASITTFNATELWTDNYIMVLKHSSIHSSSLCIG